MILFARNFPFTFEVSKYPLNPEGKTPSSPCACNTFILKGLNIRSKGEKKKNGKEKLPGAGFHRAGRWQGLQEGLGPSLNPKVLSYKATPSPEE